MYSLTTMALAVAAATVMATTALFEAVQSFLDEGSRP